MRQSLIACAALAAAAIITTPASAMPLSPTVSSAPASADIMLVSSGGVSGSAKRRYYVEKSYDYDHRGGKYHGKRQGYEKKTSGRKLYKGFGPKQGDYRFSYTGRVGGVVPRSGAGKAPKARHTRPRIIQLR